MAITRAHGLADSQLKLVPSGSQVYARQLSVVPPDFTFRFIDLFAGIGGMRRGFEQAGGRCVFTCEWDPYAQKTYKANFGDEEIAGDIRSVDAAAIPEFDVLVAGFPCQPFSIAGVSKKNALGQPHGFDCETQGTLFFEVQRILKARRPAAFLLENVKNLLSHDKGRTFRVIHTVLTRELGYHVRWKIIDARHFVPQHRERIFIVGFRDSSDFEFDALSLPPADSTLAAVLHPEDGSERPEQPFTEGDDGRVSKRYGLTRHLWAYLRTYAEKHKAAGNGFGYGLVRPSDVARTLSARYYKDGSEILVRRSRRTPRRLTPRECARLMGFDPLLPETPDRRFVIPVSDTRAYKQFGNAVVVPVVKAVASLMTPTLARDLDACAADRTAAAVAK